MTEDVLRLVALLLTILFAFVSGYRFGKKAGRK